MKIRVSVYADARAFDKKTPFRVYVMEHNNEEQRRVLGMQCRNAFEAGQCISTVPLIDLGKSK